MLRFIFVVVWAALLPLTASSPSKISGKWFTERTFTNDGEEHLEREKLNFQPDTFTLRLQTTIRRGALLVKNMKIRAGGLWKARGDILVLVMQEIRFEGVEETQGIDPDSFEKLIRQLRGRYLDDPIRILEIRALDESTLSVKTEEGGVKTYRRNP